MKIAIALALLALGGCSEGSTSQSDQYSHPADMAGSYFNQSAAFKTNMYLSADGKGAFLSTNHDGSFKQLMTFNWAVNGDQFYMTDIYFTKDRKNIIKAISDSHTEYTFSGSDIRSHVASGDWIYWVRINNTPDLSIINAIKHE